MSGATDLTSVDRRLTSAQLHQLAAVPAQTEWFANLDNPRTRRASQTVLQNFMCFASIQRLGEFRVLTRACARLAQGARDTRTVKRDHPAQARCPLLTV